MLTVESRVEVLEGKIGEIWRFLAKTLKTVEQLAIWVKNPKEESMVEQNDRYN